MDRNRGGMRMGKPWRWPVTAAIALAAGFAAVRGVGHRPQVDAGRGEVDVGVEVEEMEPAPTGFKSQARADSEKSGRGPAGREPSREGRELVQARVDLAAARARHRRALLARLGERIRKSEASGSPVPEGLKAAFGALKTQGKP